MITRSRIEAHSSNQKDSSHVTKVPAARHRIVVSLALCLLLFPSPKFRAQVTSSAHKPGPAESLYLLFSNSELDPAKVFRVREVSLDRPSIHITLEDGTIAFTRDVLGKITGAFFEGDGEVLLTPPNEVERKSMSLFTGMAILSERFSTAYFRFNDNTAYELQPGLRAPDQPAEFISRWNETARRLASGDAMRLLASYIDSLPTTGIDGGSPTIAPDPGDRLLHARLQGNNLGVFDIFFDSTAGEQVAAGQSRNSEDGTSFYDVWTSFSPPTASRMSVAEKNISQAIPTETESHQYPFLVRSYVIDARVRPPKELEAQVDLQLDADRGGSRFLVFELSRFLHIKSVEADGKPVEFLQNPAIEGTHLARTGNDLVAIVLPERPQEGQKIILRFIYGGEVLAEAGKGLLYVGARGMWYPNRGMEMSNFDLTFHYPPGWTLVATGKPDPVAAPSANNASGSPHNSAEELTSHWLSERPIPVAGFNLGKICSRQCASRRYHRRELRHQGRGKRLSSTDDSGATTRPRSRPNFCSSHSAPTRCSVSSAQCGCGCRIDRPRRALLCRTLRSLPVQPTRSHSNARDRKPGMAGLGLPIFLRFEPRGTSGASHQRHRLLRGARRS